ncbi:MAG: alpha/beta hydrolase [Dehalococcoidia bacterium]|nr:alpha/beta hydrolase [Dehalococcoidia bacterium]
MEQHDLVTKDDSGKPITIDTERGGLRAVLHHKDADTRAMILVGGIDGGFNGPSDLYRDLAEALTSANISALRLDFRVHGSPGNIPEAEYDTMRGIDYLRGLGIRSIALVGHSFGGAVVITVAHQRDEVKAVITLSSQTYGTRPVANISPRPLLLVHGGDDQRLPPSCSEYLYARALEPKELVIMQGATHSLRQRREDVFNLLRDWLKEKLVD